MFEGADGCGQIKSVMFVAYFIYCGDSFHASLGSVCAKRKMTAKMF